MKLHYYADTDSLYIELSDRVGAETREIAPGINVDFDADGRPVGLDIDHASGSIDLSRIESSGLPLPHAA